MNIYVHIPFCRSRCAYCGFLSHCNVEYEEKYINALLVEIEKRSKNFKSEKVSTIYFGGGTPSFISPMFIDKILNKLRGDFEFTKIIEITIEANPEDINISNLTAWKKSGINRISIGVQSFNNEVRERIGRTLDRSEVIDKIKLTKKYFKNVGVDLISALPGDDFSNLKYGINIISGLGVNHISLYDLEIAEGSFFAKNSENFAFKTDEEKEEFLQKAWQLFSDIGFRQYEISNFSRNNEFCKHNLDFWRGKNYIGFGLGAVSRIDNNVINNTENFDRYLNFDLRQRVEEVSEKDKTALDLSTALRLDFSATIAIKKYEKVSGKSLENKLESLSESGFFNKETKNLTGKGKLLHNSVMNFLLGK